MKNTHARGMVRLAVTAAAAILVGLVGGCREAPGPGEEVDPRGVWIAEDTATVFGRTLVTELRIEITDTAAELSAITVEGTEVVHRLTAAGTYVFGEQTVSFTYTGGEQSEDLGDGTFDVETMVEMGTEDLADIMADVGGTRGCTLSATTFVIDPGLDTELQFSKQTE